MNLVIPNGGFCLVDIWRVIKLVQGRSSVILSDILKVCSISFFDFVVWLAIDRRLELFSLLFLIEKILGLLGLRLSLFFH